MKREIQTIVLIAVLLIMTANIVSSSKSVEDIKEKNPFLKNSTDEWKIEFEIKMLYMEDIIDPEDQQTENTPYFPEWYIKIWILDGIDDNGDDYWEYNFGSINRNYLENIGITHEWTIENIDEVIIKIELWDLDGEELEYCDINGDSMDKKTVEFKYFPFDNTCDYSGSGGNDIGGYITGCKFDGIGDGTQGSENDDNDVLLIVDVTDNYNPAKLEFSEKHEIYFGEVKVGIPKDMVFSLKNIGDFTANGIIYMDEKNPSNTDIKNFVIIQGAGEFKLEPGEEIEIEIRFTPDKYSSMPFASNYYGVNLFADGDDPCLDNHINLVGKSITNPNGKPPEKPSTPQGESSGNIIKQYTYTTSTTDNEGNDIRYGWDWNGDYIVDEWVGPYKENTEISTTHKWTEENTYKIRVISRDNNNQYSLWSDPLVVTMPKSKTLVRTIYQIIQKLSFQFPILDFIL